MLNSRKEIGMFTAILIACFLLLYSSNHTIATPPDEINSRIPTVQNVWNGVDVVDTTTITSSWIKIGDYQYFALYLTLTNDAADWKAAFGGADSLELHLVRTQHHGRTKPDANTAAFLDPHETTQDTIVSITITDTSVTEINWVIPLHGDTDYAFEGGSLARYQLLKGTKHYRDPTKTDISITLDQWTQP